MCVYVCEMLVDGVVGLRDGWPFWYPLLSCLAKIHREKRTEQMQMQKHLDAASTWQDMEKDLDVASTWQDMV
jgi:hypothetical protein